MKKLLPIILLAIFSLLLIDASAKCTRVATVKYEQKYGWSKKYTVDVTFMTGYELNQATGTFKYNMYSVYASIFWGDGQASVIKLRTTLLCGNEVSCDCIDNSMFDLKGSDQDGDNWNICLSDFCS